jgi:hypothetical protein
LVWLFNKTRALFSVTGSNSMNEYCEMLCNTIQKNIKSYQNYTPESEAIELIELISSYHIKLIAHFSEYSAYNKINPIVRKDIKSKLGTIHYFYWQRIMPLLETFSEIINVQISINGTPDLLELEERIATSKRYIRFGNQHWLEDVEFNRQEQIKSRNQNRTNTLVDSVTKPKEPQGRCDNQINFICNVINNFGLDALNISEGWKPKIAIECLKNKSLFSKSGFKRAWIAGNKLNKILLCTKTNHIENLY